MPSSAEHRIASRQRFSDMMRHQTEEALEKLDADPSSDFDVNIESMISTCKHRFGTLGHPPRCWALDLHDLWRLFIWCAKGTPADDIRQDMRASQILHIRELGVVLSSETQPQEACTEEGKKIWVDLPYLTTDLWMVWDNATGMKPSHMNNLAAFTARLVSIGVCTDELAFCMLQLCKQVLETEPSINAASLVELLPAVSQWFKHCGGKLYGLCMSRCIATGETSFSPGPLAQATGVQENGFSLKRWLFWRKTVENFAISKDSRLAVEGKGILERMIVASQVESPLA